MFEWNCNIKEVNDNDEHEENAYIEDDNVDIPWKFLQPVNDSESTQELGEIINYWICFPFISKLFQN